MHKFPLAAGSALLALAVIFGAFGAHFIQDVLTPDRFQVYQTAVEYHFYHALGLLIVGTASLSLEDSFWFHWSVWLLFTGILLFSGSLYFLTLANAGWAGAVTPAGGVAFILGWSFFAAGIVRQKE